MEKIPIIKCITTRVYLQYEYEWRTQRWVTVAAKSRKIRQNIVDKWKRMIIKTKEMHKQGELKQKKRKNYNNKNKKIAIRKNYNKNKKVTLTKKPRP